MQVMVEVVMEAVVDEEVDKKVNEEMPEESKIRWLHALMRLRQETDLLLNIVLSSSLKASFSQISIFHNTTRAQRIILHKIASNKER